MHLIDIDRAVAHLRRRLDRIMCCTSGMQNFPLVAARVERIKAALAEEERTRASAPPVPTDAPLHMGI